MPCFRWVYDLNTELVHAIRTSEKGGAKALCGRSLERYTAPAKGQPKCRPCTTRDVDIHKNADHKSRAPRRSPALVLPAPPEDD